MGDTLLLDHINFKLNGGDKIVLLGRSGSGKSLLLQALGDLLPCTAASIYLKGVPLHEITPVTYRSQVALCHQSPQLSDGTVLDNLTAPFRFSHHQNKRFKVDWHLHRLARFGRASDFLDKSIHELSGGERQMVSFLRTLQFNPTVALFDEVTSALDGDTATALIQLVCEWHDDTKALLWVTHHPNEQVQLQANVWRMHNGRLMETV